MKNEVQKDLGQRMERAICRQDSDLCRELIDLGVTLDTVTVMGGLTALEFLCRIDCVEIAEILVEAGAKPYIPGEPEVTMLHISAIFGSSRCLRYFANLNLDINGCANGMPTPIQLAVQRRRTEAAILLIELGANPYVSEDIGTCRITLLHRAVQYDDLELARILVGAGLSPDYIPTAAPEHYRTPMQNAVFHDSLECLKYFLGELSCAPRQKCLNGRDLAHLAPPNGRVAPLLRSLGAL
jgi:ankyrin repeat protein